MPGSQSANWNGSAYLIPALGDTGWSGATGVDGLLISLAGNAVTLATAQNVSGKTFTSCTYSGNFNISSITNGAGILTINTSGTITIPNATDTLVGRQTTDTLKNKTLDTSCIFGDAADTTKDLAFSLSGATAGKTVTFSSAHTNNRTITIQDSTDTLVGRATTDTLTNKTFSDSTCQFGNVSDTTKQAIFSLGGAIAGKVLTLASSHTNNRTVTFPDATATLATVFSSSQVIADTPNGHGAINTKIRRWTNATSTGSDITYADSANNGGTFTINTAGVYAVCYSDVNTGAAAALGISINSNQLTTSIASITTANRVLLTVSQTNTTNSLAAIVRCAVNDVIRAHDDGTCNGSASIQQFIIVRIL